MRFAVIASGSHGDVQPYIALAQGLKRAGHTVRFVTNENFEGLVRTNGLEFWPLSGNVQDVAQSDEMKRLLASGKFLAIMRESNKALESLMLDWARQGLEACREVDALVVGVGGLNLALALAQKLKLPLLQAYVFPFTPTSAFPAPLFPAWLGKLGGGLKHLSFHAFRQIMWQGFRSADRRLREVLELAPLPFSGFYGMNELQTQPILYGYSPHVLPKPADWDARVHVTGYWFLDAPDWTPPESLVTFLAQDPKPVAIGFGSMGNHDPAASTELVVRALEQSQTRAVLLSGWGGLQGTQLPENVYLMDTAPHAWLFPRVAAVVHHGGAGTTAAGLRAGVPSIITPFFGDQPFWGERVAALGVGVKPLPHKHLKADALAAALQRVTTDMAMQARAQNLGALIRAEDGVGTAVRVIEEGMGLESRRTVSSTAQSTK